MNQLLHDGISRLSPAIVAAGNAHVSAQHWPSLTSAASVVEPAVSTHDSSDGAKPNPLPVAKVDEQASAHETAPISHDRKPVDVNPVTHPKTPDRKPVDINPVTHPKPVESRSESHPVKHKKRR